jgi:hypothetical protein
MEKCLKKSPVRAWAGGGDFFSKNAKNRNLAKLGKIGNEGTFI